MCWVRWGLCWAHPLVSVIDHSLHVSEHRRVETAGLGFLVSIPQSMHNAAWGIADIRKHDLEEETRFWNVAS